MCCVLEVGAALATSRLCLKGKDIQITFSVIALLFHVQTLFTLLRADLEGLIWLMRGATHWQAGSDSTPVNLLSTHSHVVMVHTIIRFVVAVGIGTPVFMG